VFLTLSIVSGWDSVSAWGAVVALAVLASIYTAFGGLRSVAVTDALQFCVMTAAGLVIWFVVWGQVGGWDGIEQRLAAADADLPGQMLHVGHDNIDVIDVSDNSAEEIALKLLLGGQYDEAGGSIIRRTPAWLAALALTIMGLAYSIVNQTQSMRMFASRSEWDLKMSVFVASVAMLIMSFFNLSMGVMGRALQPVQDALPHGRQDAIYPYLVSLVDTVGLKGLVVAGILAAALSTYDSIGSSLSALLTRDVYARLIVKNRDDRHYLRVGQWLTPLIIALSFAYVPFLLQGGMVMFYLELTSTFVIPLLTLFLMGTLTRVHRRSGTIGLLAGALYGIVRLLSPWMAETFGITVMPGIMLNTWAAYPISMLITAGVMVLVSVVVGWERPGELLHESHVEEGAWLRSSQTAARNLESTATLPARNHGTPPVLAFAVVAAGCLLSFVVFW
jgi:SSS family solute:Na+ symporter